MKLAAIWILCMSMAGQSLAATWKMVYPRPTSEQDIRQEYPVKLLTLALEQTGVKFELIPSERTLTQSKAISQLRANREINVVWSMTDASRENDLLPIRIPIYRGLIGWRIFLTRPDIADLMQEFENRNDLQELMQVQGHDWPDTRILQANGFEVQTHKAYDVLFDLVRKGRGDVFGRSVLEIWAEAESDLGQGLVVEPNWGLYYPTATYFFVNKKNATLAHLLETGLNMAVENGDFNDLFYREHQDLLDAARMDERRFIQLDNPILPDETPLERTELWYQGPKIDL